jgi:hypothetical protein
MNDNFNTLMDLIKKEFTPEQLQQLLQRNGLDKYALFGAAHFNGAQGAVNWLKRLAKDSTYQGASDGLTRTTQYAKAFSKVGNNTIGIPGDSKVVTFDNPYLS